MTEHRQKTSVFWAGYEDHYFLGKRLYADLLGRSGFFDLMVRALRGSPLKGDEEEVLNAMATILAVGDPRIWPLKLTRILSSYDSYALGMSGSFLSQRRANIGGETAERLGSQMLELLQTSDHGRDEEALGSAIEVLYRSKSLLGFGVPFRPKDERAEQLSKLVVKWGRQEGPHWVGFQRIVRFVEKTYGLPVNFAGGFTAVLFDLGFPVGGIGPMLHTLLIPPLMLNAVEEAQSGNHFYQHLPEDIFSVKRAAAGTVLPSARKQAV